MVFRFCGIPHIYFFCLEPTLKKTTLGWEQFPSVSLIILKALLRKLLNISFVLSFFSKITWYIDNGTWETPYSWRFFGHGSTYVLILSKVNIMKQKWAKVPAKLSVGLKVKTVLQRTLHQSISFIIVFFFFSQTNLVFKFTLVLIE